MNLKKLFLGVFLSCLCVPEAFGMLNAVGTRITALAQMVSFWRRANANVDINLNPTKEAESSVNYHAQEALAVLSRYCTHGPASIIVSYCQPYTKKFSITGEELGKIQKNGDYINDAPSRACQTPLWGITKPMPVAQGSLCRNGMHPLCTVDVLCCTDKRSHNEGQHLRLFICDEAIVCDQYRSYTAPKNLVRLSKSIGKHDVQWNNVVYAPDEICDIGIADFDKAACGGTILAGSLYNTREDAVWRALEQAVKHKSGLAAPMGDNIGMKNSSSSSSSSSSSTTLLD